MSGRQAPAASPAARLALLADELRAVAAEGLLYAERDDKPYDRHRYERIRRVTAEVAALVIDAEPDALEAVYAARSLAMSPLLGGEGALFDTEGRILLIRRADDRRWAMPGGLLEVGEAAAEGSCREVEEETAIECRATGLIGLYDNRRQVHHAPHHLLHLVFHCEALDPTAEPKVMPECIDVGWFGADELPDLSSGHEMRIPDAFAFQRSPGRVATVWDG